MDVSNIDLTTADDLDPDPADRAEENELHINAFGKAGKGGKGMTGACWRCGGKGHQARNCPTPEEGTGRHVCYECGGKGHYGRDHEKGAGKADNKGYKGKNNNQKGYQKGFGKDFPGKGYEGKGKGVQINAWTDAGAQSTMGIRSMNSMDGARYATMEGADHQWNEHDDWAYGPWSQAASGLFSVGARARTATQVSNRYACLERDDDENDNSDRNNQIREERKQHEKNMFNNCEMMFIKGCVGSRPNRCSAGSSRQPCRSESPKMTSTSTRPPRISSSPQNSPQEPPRPELRNNCGQDLQNVTQDKNNIRKMHLCTVSLVDCVGKTVNVWEEMHGMCGKVTGGGHDCQQCQTRIPRRVRAAGMATTTTTSSSQKTTYDHDHDHTEVKSGMKIDLEALADDYRTRSAARAHKKILQTARPRCTIDGRRSSDVKHAMPMTIDETTTSDCRVPMSLIEMRNPEGHPRISKVGVGGWREIEVTIDSGALCKELEAQHEHILRSIAARCLYLSLGRPAIQFAVKEVCRQMSANEGFMEKVAEDCELHQRKPEIGLEVRLAEQAGHH